MGRVLMGRGKSYRAGSLDLTTWLDALGKADAVSINGEADTGLVRRLRRTFMLALLAPDPLRQEFAPSVNEAAFERLLDDGDVDQAVGALLSTSLILDTSKPDGQFIAVVYAAELGVSGTGSAANAAKATLDALVDCMVAAAQQIPDETGVLNPDQHRYQSAQRPSSTQH